MTLVVVNIVTWNQCNVMWNKFTAVAAMLLMVKRETCRFIRRVERRSATFRDFKSNLGI